MNSADVAPLPRYITVDGLSIAVISQAAHAETKSYADQRKMFERHGVTVLGRDRRGWIIQCKDREVVRHIRNKYYMDIVGSYASVDDGIVIASRAYPFTVE